MGSQSHERDEVDRLIAAWKRERPDLDLSPLAVLSRITRIARHLDIARRDAFGDLENWGFDVLAALRRAGAPHQLSPGQLMQETMVTSGTMTNRLDRLEELQLITREPDPSDGRGSLVTLTKAGSGSRVIKCNSSNRSSRFVIVPLVTMISCMSWPGDS